MRLTELLTTIDKNQAIIDSYGKLDNAILRKLNYKFTLDWNYHSNKIEGGTLTKQETRALMTNSINIKDKPVKDFMEMRGHNEVVTQMLEIGKGEARISEKRMKEIHKLIMYEEPNSELKKQIGEWKTIDNEIINYNGEKINFTPKKKVADEIHQLLNTTNTNLDILFANKSNTLHPVLIASNFHIEYVSIHPFYDGNGRTARIFTNLILIACGLPVVIIKEEHKNVYGNYLADIQVYEGSHDLFHSFIANRVIESQELILRVLNGEDIDEPTDLDKRLTAFDKELEATFNDENEVKTELSFDVVQQMYTSWVKDLLTEMIPLAQKFNKYYTTVSHSISLSSFSTGGYIQFNNETTHDILAQIDDAFANNENRTHFNNNDFSIRFHFQYGPFKKGGIKTFGCNYYLEIKYEQIKYSYLQTVLENDDRRLETKFEKLLHQPLSPAEIKSITTEMGNTLLQHMRAEVNKLNKNEE